MSTIFQKAFIDHPQSINETYFEHLWFAASFSTKLFAAGCAALLHAFVPALCEKTAGKIVCKLAADIELRNQCAESN